MLVGKVSDRGDGFEVTVQSIHLKITLDQVHFDANCKNCISPP